MESILTSIKKMLGITEEYEHFDADLIMHINSFYDINTAWCWTGKRIFHIRKR